MKKLMKLLESYPWFVFLIALSLGTVGMYFVLDSLIFAVIYFAAGLMWARLQTRHIDS